MLSRPTATPDDDLDLLTVEDVAELCHVHEGSVRRWLATGVLPSVKIGLRRYVPRAAIAAQVDVAMADWSARDGDPDAA